jgi:hypothetical protein
VLCGTLHSTKVSVSYSLRLSPVPVSSLNFAFEVRISSTAILFPRHHRKVQYFVLA